MADNTNSQVTAVSIAADNKKVKKNVAAIGAKKPKAKPTHPPTSEMVNNAIKNLKERGGSSLLAIKKYLAGNYKVDSDKLSPFIKKYLKSAVVSGTLIQTKGKGASGSFKLSNSAKASGESAKKKKPAVTKKPTEKKAKNEKLAKEKVPATKKKEATVVVVAAKKPTVEKKKKEKEVAKTIKKTGQVKAKSPKQKPTKPSKTAAKATPKSPKPKKAIAPVAAKKAIAAKKPTKK